MHVFIDTNILLNFFHFSKDELDTLSNVFASHKHGSAKVHLTQQVRDEFTRNREAKIKDALKRFKGVKFAAQLPSFMKGYVEYNDIKKLSVKLQQKTKSILEQVDADIAARDLLADRLIGDIFTRSKVIKTSKKIYEQATMRMAIGNPPGKNRSIGDAINWLLLLQSVPNDEDIHVISEDGDFYSCLNEDIVHPFLEEEWTEKKNSSIRVYRTLSMFMGEHFDGVAFSFDKDKDALIEELRYAGSFAASHGLIEELESYSYFSLKEVKKILSAAVENGQFGMIVGDYDVSDFLNRIAVPHTASVNEKKHKAILKGVIQDQKDRAEEDAE